MCANTGTGKAFNEFEAGQMKRTTLPDDYEIHITDNTKKKLICLINNDTQLEKASSIGYMCQEKMQKVEMFVDFDDDDTEDLKSNKSKVLAKDTSKRVNAATGAKSSSKATCTNSLSSEPQVLSQRASGKSSSKAVCTDGVNLSNTPSIKRAKTIESALKKKAPLWRKGCFEGVPLYDPLNEFSPNKSHFVSQDEDISFKKQDIATVLIKEEDVELKEVIGKGQFGTVHRGTWKEMQVAIKVIAKGYGEPDMKEIDICRHLKHPNIIMLLGWVVTENDVLVLMNYIKGVNLAYAIGLIKPKKKEIIPMDTTYNGFIMYYISQGMAYLHEKGVIHQDLKPANIMVEDKTVKPIICDFGISKLKDGTMITNVGGSNAGTLGYQHKEQLHGEKPTVAVDIYSFGVIMGEVFTRQPAWSGMTALEVRNEIFKGNYPSFQDVPLGVEEVLSLCFQTASISRPSFRDLIPKLEFLSEIDLW